ncbi:MAG: ECF transporter S component [Clostridia bacterium]|nr:ECF transporter S component [Clostridia bacterium]
MQKKTDYKKLIRKIAITAVFAAFAVALKAFTNAVLNIPIFGIKIGFAGIFTFFPAILCGPVWGGIASALSDVLGYLIAPDGAYIPWLTLTAFCGGVIKGLLWMLLTKKAGKKLRVILLSVFVLIGSAGAAFHISLHNDGLINGLAAKQAELPSKGAVTGRQAAGEYSFLTSLTVDLAKYKNDTFTLTNVSAGGDTELPSVMILDGYETKITKIGPKALRNVKGAVTVPESYKTIADDALGDNKDVTLIRGKAGSAAESFAKKANVAFEAVEADGKKTFDGSSGETEFEFSSSDNYRKNLAIYINMLVLGLELTGLIGMLFVIINILLARGEKTGERTAEIIKIAIAVTVAGIITTTVNTFILRELLDAWRGKEFLILYVPRLVEELLVCVLHTYIISILYGSIVHGGIKKEIDKLK